MYRIEFIGLPGSGKSSIRTRLVQLLRASDKDKYMTFEDIFLVVCRKKSDKVYRAILKMLPNFLALKLTDKIMHNSYLRYHSQSTFLAKYSKSLESFLRSNIFKNMNIDDKKRSIERYTFTGSVYECISDLEHKECVVFFDEGFVQNSLIFLNLHAIDSSDQDNVIAYLENVPLPDIVVYVQADNNTCYNRMISRPKGFPKRFAHMDNNDEKKILARVDCHLKTVTKWLKKNRNVTVVEINNDNDFDNTMAVLKRKIQMLI